MQYKKGSENINADTLSRIYCDLKEENNVSISALFESEDEDLDFLQELKNKQKADPEVADLKRECKIRGGKFNNFAYIDKVMFCLR